MLVSATFVCFSAWAIFLTRKGEDTASLPPVEPGEAARIARINQELLGLMKNFPGSALRCREEHYPASLVTAELQPTPAHLLDHRLDPFEVRICQPGRLRQGKVH